MWARLFCCLTVVACHVTSQSEITRPGRTQRVQHPEGAVARRPTLVLTDAGALRFVEPLECPTEEIVSEQHATEIVRRPNLATFVVGVIATAAGGILTVRGATDGDGASNPFTVIGAASLAGGLPFAIGPWVGNGTELRPGATGEPVRRPGIATPCGERALAARSATLVVRGVEVFGTIDANGVFAISPYMLADAFDESAATAWDVSAKVDVLSGARTVEALIDGRAIASHAAAFLAHADFDPKIEAMRMVPGISAGALRLSLTQTAHGAAVRVVLALMNDGPGPAYAVRGHITAPGTPALDGRVMYFGYLAKGAALSRELLIPVSASVANDLRNAQLDLSLELRDAHGTAPATPVRFRGTVLVDAPR